MKSLTEIQEAFSHDRFATNQANIRIVSAQPDFAVCEMPITPEHLNARGTVMGGAIFTLADFTAAVAAKAFSAVCRSSLYAVSSSMAGPDSTSCT